jgi:tRNA threonylcarbamoyladenosine biosynthesis protein TsaB
MLILAVDTSGKNGSIALAQFEAGSFRTLEVVALEGGTFSAELVPQISTLLVKHGLTKRDIDGLAVVSGPGSFTGLRVGLAVVKALAEVLQKPIAAVSLLEAVAVAAAIQGNVLAALDAGRGGIYCGEYLISNSCATLITEQFLTVETFLGLTGERTITTPDSGIAERARQNNLPVVKIDAPKADTVARIGFLKLQSGERISPEALDANYIRRTDAEIRKSEGAQPA